MRLIDADKTIERIREADADPHKMILADADIIIEFLRKQETVDSGNEDSEELKQRIKELEAELRAKCRQEVEYLIKINELMQQVSDYQELNRKILSAM